MVSFSKNKYSCQYISRGFDPSGENIVTIAYGLVLIGRALDGARPLSSLKDRGGPVSSDLHQNFVFVICSGISWQRKQDKFEIVLF